MDVNQLRVQIETSFAGCRACGEAIDGWPEAEPGEKGQAGHQVAYYPRTAVFAGICPCGHLNEFYLAEVKAGEIIAHDLTERTCGEFVLQRDCKHAQKAKMELGAGQAVPTENGSIEGPCTFTMCAACGLRQKVEAKQVSAPKFGLIGLDGRPIKGGE